MRVEAALIQSTHSTGATILNSTKSTMNTIRQELKSWALLFSSRYRQRTWIGVTIGFFQQWSAINSLLYFSVLLVAKIGPQDSEMLTLVLSGGIGIVQLIAVVPAIIIIDRAGMLT
jgi:hypothetical protein